MLETFVMQWKHMAQRLHRDPSGPCGIQEAIVMPWNIMEPSVINMYKVLAFANITCFIMLTFIKELLLKLRVLLIRMLCCDANVS